MNGQLRSYYVNQGYNPTINSGYDTYNNTLVMINKALGVANTVLTALNTTHSYSSSNRKSAYTAGSQALYNMRLNNLRKQLQSGVISRQHYYEQVQLLNQFKSNMDDLKKAVDKASEKELKKAE